MNIYYVPDAVDNVDGKVTFCDLKGLAEMQIQSFSAIR